MSGLLTFKYKTELSRVRESYLLDFLEQQEVVQVAKTKALFDVQLTTINPNKENVEEAFAAMKRYVGLALPSDIQKGKISDIKAIDKKELAAIKTRLKTKKLRPEK